MADAAEERLRRDVGCPFCGLVCDDLTVGKVDGRLSVVEAGCWLSRQGYDNSEISASAMVDGRTVTRSAALARAAEILAGSSAPVFAVAADVAGARSALRLVDRLGGVVDHPDSAALLRGIRVIQDSGSLATTLSEVRNRADLILIVGPDPSPRLPRFFERCVEAGKTLFGLDPAQRQLIRLGPPAEGPPPARATPAVTELTCSMERLPAAIAALCAGLRGGGPAVQQIDGVTPGHLEELAGRLKGARYGVIVWVPAAFDMPGGELVGQGILDLAREATRSTRCSILTLGGTGNVIGVNQVCTWQSGYPLPTGFGQGVPEHDPYRFSARRMVSDGEADVLVWIAAFGGSAPPVRAGVPTILLAPQPPVSGPPPAVFMPVGMPGLDHAGTVFRTDSVVALRLPALRPGAAPEVASVLGEIETLLVKGRGR